MLNTIPITPGKLFGCLETLYQLRYPAYLAGPQGIGKSAVVRQFAEGRNLRLITIMLSQIEPSDIRGLPFLDRETARTRWLLPEFYPTPDDTSAGILFLDELANAEPRVQVAAYQLLLDRRVGEYTLPPGWVCVAAGNRLEDNANVYELSSALADRLVFFNVTCEPRDWLSWARENSIAPEVLAFIQVKPDFLDGNQMQQNTDQIIVPTPRSWERVSNIIRTETDKEKRQYLLGGVIGESASIEFFHVLEEIQDLPPMQDLFQADNHIIRGMLPRTVAGLYGLAYSVAAYCDSMETFRKACVIFNELDQLDRTLPGAEIQTLAFEILLEKSEKRGIMYDLVVTPEYGAYRRKGREIVDLAKNLPQRK
jgi:hypothetical protein